MNGFDPDKVKIRPAVKDESRTIAELYRISSDGVSDYVWSKLAEPGEDLLDVGERRYRRQGFVFSYENCSVAVHNDRIIGMLVAFPMIVDPEYIESDPVLLPYSRLEEDNSYYVCGVAVFPEFQRAGIGKRFMALAEDKTRELVMTKLSLIVFEQNAGAKQLYDSLGYEVVGRQAVVPHSMIHYSGDALLMVKHLD